MLVIPNTTTTASDQDPGAAVFPTTDSGALTSFAAGYLFVANNSAQFSIRKGSNPPGDWTPYALVSPTLIPISTDRGGRKTPDFIYGVKAIDAVAGTHAQVFGALFQPGEAGFVPSAQFGGTIATGGGFVPMPTVGQELAYAQVTASVPVAATTEATATVVVTAPAVTFDGTTVALVMFSAPQVAAPASGSIVHVLYDNGVSIGQMAQLGNVAPAGLDAEPPFERSVRFAPGAGTHVFSWRAFVSAGNGVIVAGAGTGVGVRFPAFLRVTQAA